MRPFVALTLLLVACTPAQGGAPGAAPAAETGNAALPYTGQGDEAVFAGGCFWCVESAFDPLPGVISATSGYIGGGVDRPTYHQVSSGGTGHTEALYVRFDPSVVSYERLLDVFWHNIDPTSANGQFCDRGSQYRSGIFYLNDDQKAAAEASLARLQQSKPFEGAIVTEITKAGPFYPAEEYHQDFWKKNPLRYQSYRAGCGRDRRLQELWGEAAGH